MAGADDDAWARGDLEKDGEEIHAIRLLLSYGIRRARPLFPLWFYGFAPFPFVWLFGTTFQTKRNSSLLDVAMSRFF